MAVCNSEFNKLDFGENIKYFKDFGSREFYSLKEILWVTFRLKNVNYLTI